MSKKSSCTPADTAEPSTAQGMSAEDMFWQIPAADRELFKAIASPAGRFWLRAMTVAGHSTTNREVDDWQFLLSVARLLRGDPTLKPGQAIHRVLAQLPGDCEGIEIHGCTIQRQSAATGLRRKLRKHSPELRDYLDAEQNGAIAFDRFAGLLAEPTAPKCGRPRLTHAQILQRVKSHAGQPHENLVLAAVEGFLAQCRALARSK